ncbi:MAG TPA: hypothetical protein VMV83_00675 [Rectinemataceae bacterium]|nr:hypothetical protein [Rectinemataceae bacterium]
MRANIGFLGILLSIPLLCSSISLSAQPAAKTVYQLGPSMIDLMLRQKTYEGASPAEIEGFRQGLEQQLGGYGRQYMMEKRGEGVPIIFAETLKLAGE